MGSQVTPLENSPTGDAGNGCNWLPRGNGGPPSPGSLSIMVRGREAVTGACWRGGWCWQVTGRPSRGKRQPLGSYTDSARLLRPSSQMHQLFGSDEKELLPQPRAERERWPPHSEVRIRKTHRHAGRPGAFGGRREGPCPGAPQSWGASQLHIRRLRGAWAEVQQLRPPP